MRQGQVDSLRTVIICIFLGLLLFDYIILSNLQDAVTDLITITQTTQEMATQNRQLINYLSNLNKAQNDIIVGGKNETRRSNQTKRW